MHAGVTKLPSAVMNSSGIGYAESFHSRLRDELTNREGFTNLAEARHLADAWRLEYKENRKVPTQRGQVHVFGRPFPGKRRLLAEKWTSPRTLQFS
jgi:hypothetical protein